MANVLDIFRALADPTRLRIVALLRAMELAVGEIAQVVDQSQPRVSRHIRILAESGLVQRRKEGSWVFLHLANDERTAPLLAYFDKIDPSGVEAQWMKADLARLAAVRNDRAMAAEAYFAQHANEWDVIRSLHIAESDVESAMMAMLAGSDIGRLLDIGTGTGRMIQLFGPAAELVTAVDRSPDMLRLARAKLPVSGADRYALLMGDFYALPVAEQSADTVILHQVLHYAHQPETVIAEAARVTASNGRLLIVDFSPHEYEELRTRDQHARLGFSDDQISGWFTASGFDLEQVSDLPGGALTIKLWLGRRRGARILPTEGRISA